jgi:hypothetical protein
MPAPGVTDVGAPTDAVAGFSNGMELIGVPWDAAEY